MPPPLALLLTIAFIVFLFRRDCREKPEVTGALWIPLIWMLIIGSRFVSLWLNVLGIPIGGRSLEDGSPIDAMVFFALIVAGVHVLNKRQVTLSKIIRDNGWLAAFLFYCLLSILWSDFPFIAFKRWIKVLGHPIMVMVLLTEPDPVEAVSRLMKRCAYVLVPLSITLIKYFPDIGRHYDAWMGIAQHTGVSDNKNLLGCLCMILGVFFFCHLLKTWRAAKNKARREELVLCLGFLGMIWWLLSMASSSTSVACLVIGMGLVMVLGFRIVNPLFIGTYVVIGILTLAAAELSFGIYAKTIELLGRDATLTDRTEVWSDVLSIKINPLLGVGFESFWLGERLETMWAKWAWMPNQAHSGYIETYINLGWTGVFLLAGIILSTFWKIRLDLLRRFAFARFRLAFLFAVLAYNYTEATFKALHIVWFAFYIIALEYQRVPLLQSQQAFEEIEEKDGACQANQLGEQYLNAILSPDEKASHAL